MLQRLGAYSLVQHPYREITAFDGSIADLRRIARTPGSALVWRMGARVPRENPPFIEQRPGGLALVAILPEGVALSDNPELAFAVQRCRPHGVLPFHHDVEATDLAQVLRRPPSDLAADVSDYLSWRGLGVDRDTTQLVRRILELSSELRSVTALARSMYLSRRALGRRLANRGLPVPSHWLQLGRLLRVAIQLQNTDQSLFSLAYEAGYPDGFSVSNQMHRLTGYRPTEVREHLGWEWLVEAWLRQEAEAGRLSPASPDRVARLGRMPTPPSTGAAPGKRDGQIQRRASA